MASHSPDTILRLIDSAFSCVERPEHFTIEDGDPECMDHDRLLHARTRETLTIDDVGNMGYDPLIECLPQGIAYFFPALARLALGDQRQFDWYPAQLALHMISGRKINDFFEYCSEFQRGTVYKLFQHIKETQIERVNAEFCAIEIDECIRRWTPRDSAS